MYLMSFNLSILVTASIVFTCSFTRANEIQEILDVRNGPHFKCKISNLATSLEAWFENDGELLIQPEEGRGSNVMRMAMRGNVSPLWANLTANFIEKEKNSVIRIYGEKADRNSTFMMINLASGYGTFIVSNKVDPNSNSDYGPREIYVNLNMHSCDQITYDQALKLKNEIYDFVPTPEFKKSLIPSGSTVVQTKYLYNKSF